MGFNSRRIVDTTGAGDAFWGAFLYKVIKNSIIPRELECVDVSGFVEFACAAASLCVEKRGAIPAIATLGEVGKR